MRLAALAVSNSPVRHWFSPTGGLAIPVRTLTSMYLYFHESKITSKLLNVTLRRKTRKMKKFRIKLKMLINCSFYEASQTNYYAPLRFDSEILASKILRASLIELRRSFRTDKRRKRSVYKRCCLHSNRYRRMFVWCFDRCHCVFDEID